MKVPADCVAIVRRLLEPPSPASADPGLVGESARLPPDAAEQLALFGDRTADLTFDERHELFEETFGRDPQMSRARQRLAERLDAGGEIHRAELQPLLDRLGATLLRTDNPYHHVIAAARILLAQD